MGRLIEPMSVKHRQLQLMKKAALEASWDKLVPENFLPPTYKAVEVGGVTFQAVLVPTTADIRPKVYVETGLSFLVWPRFAGMRYRFVLIPADYFVEPARWALNIRDIEDWILWSNHMNHIVGMSTFKSGAGVPFLLHAQSIPVCSDDQTVLTALKDISAEQLIGYEEMPFFQDVRMSTVPGYPVHCIKIQGKNSEDGLQQVAKKVFEIALNYDHLKSFNLVILPSAELSACVFFFPRRKDGTVVYGHNRWQIGALEVNGLMLTKSEEGFEKMSSANIKEIFQKTCPNRNDFELFLRLINTF